MLMRTTPAALLLALALPLSTGAAAGADDPPAVRVVPSKLPKGGHPTVAWVDAADQVIHDGARTVTVTPRFAKTRLTEVRRAGGLYVACDSASAVLRVNPDGTYAPLVASTDHPIAVDDSGLTLAAAVTEPSSGLSYLELVRIADGAVLTRIQTDVRDLFDLTDGVVTFEAPKRQGKTYSRLSTWDTRGQQIDLGGRRLADPTYVDVDAALMSRQVHGDFEGVLVQPIERRSAAEPWRAELSTVESVSPDGRWVATYRLSGKDSSYAPGTLTIRDARTGVPRRSVRVALGGVSGWESNRDVVLNAFQRSKDGYALVRLDRRTGQLERLSGYSLNDVDRLFSE